MAGRTVLDVHGQAVAPGFINMLAHPEESFLIDGRALSDLTQGVTLEVLGEDSMGPLTPHMKELMVQRQGDIKFPVTWTTLGQYLETLERRGISPNVASFVGAPDGAHLRARRGRRAAERRRSSSRCARSCTRAWKKGALGLTTMLIYAPATYAKTPELIALAQESARCGGIYTAHMRSEGDRIEAAIQETIDIARASGAPAEIYHLKVAGQGQLGQARPRDRHDRAGARLGHAHLGQHVHLHGRRHGTGRGDALLGAGRRARGLDRATEGSGDPRQGDRRDARSAPGHLGEPLRRGRRPRACCCSNSRIRS